MVPVTRGMYLAPPYPRDWQCTDRVIAEYLPDIGEVVPRAPSGALTAAFLGPWAEESGAWIECPRSTGSAGCESRYRLRVRADYLRGDRAEPKGIRWHHDPAVALWQSSLLRAAISRYHPDPVDIRTDRARFIRQAEGLPPWFWRAFYDIGSVPPRDEPDGIGWYLRGGADPLAGATYPVPALT